MGFKKQLVLLQFQLALLMKPLIPHSTAEPSKSSSSSDKAADPTTAGHKPALEPAVINESPLTVSVA